MLESYVRAPAQRGAEWCAASVPREMAATGASAGACVKECAVSGGGGGGDACGGATRRSSRHVRLTFVGSLKAHAGIINKMRRFLRPRYLVARQVEKFADAD